MFKNKMNKSITYFLTSLIMIALIFCVGGNQKTYANQKKNLSNLVKGRWEQAQEKEELKNQISDSIQFNIFKKNFETNEWATPKEILYGIEYTQKRITERFPVCSLKTDEIATILYFSNSSVQKSFQAELEKEYIEGIEFPKSENYEKACKRITICIQQMPSKTYDFACNETLNEFYRQGIAYFWNKERILNSNRGADKYWNKNLEDSPYDIFYDIGHISKIMFKDVKEVPEIIFYKTPLFNSKSQSSQGWSNQTNSSKTTNKSNNQTTNKWNKNTKNTEDQNVEKSDLSSEIIKDQEILSFLEALDKNNDESPLSSSSPFWKNICENPTPIETEWVKTPWRESSSEKFSEAELDDYLFELVEDDDRIQEQSNPTLEVGDPNDPANQQIIDSQNPEGVRQKLLACTKKCEGLHRDEKQVCKLQCLCLYWISPPLLRKEDPRYLVDEGALKIRACTIPSDPAIVNNRTKTIYSIEEIFDEVNDVTKSLAEGGRLTAKNRQKEFFDTSIRSFNFSKMLAFVINLQSRSISSNASPEDRKAKQEELNTKLYNNSKSSNLKDPSKEVGLEKDKYIIWRDHNANSVARPSVNSTSTPTTLEKPVKAPSEIALMQQKTVDYQLNIWNFLEKNALLLEGINEAIIERDQYLLGLLEKK